MKPLKKLCTPRKSVFDVSKRDTVLNLNHLVDGKIREKDFFEENYVTDGMKTLLLEAFRRLEFYHILRKRLFQELPKDKEVDEIAQGYAKAVREGKQMDITAQSPGSSRWPAPASASSPSRSCASASRKPSSRRTDGATRTFWRCRPLTKSPSSLTA